MPVSSPQPPQELQLVIDFVNTADLETGADELPTPEALGEWLAGRGLLPSAGASPTATDHVAARDLRQALRSVALAHNGHPEDPGALAVLEDAAERGQLSVRFRPDGSVGPEPRAAGVAGALARVLVPVALASADGSWERFKACRDDGCQWAFYDGSRNRSGRWCDMAVCGNRTKVRVYRSKRAAP
jgi:predicted RNA-binding Zn ribbon-like protein